MMEAGGYDKDRFLDVKDESFSCLICLCIAKNPKECNKCGFVFCSKCISKWFLNKRICPNRCRSKITKIKSKGFLKIYNNLNVKCSQYIFCNTITELSKLQKHEQNCSGSFLLTIKLRLPYLVQLFYQKYSNWQIQNIFKWINYSGGSGQQIQNSKYKTFIQSNENLLFSTYTTQQSLVPGEYLFEINIGFQDQVQVGIGFADIHLQYKTFYKKDNKYDGSKIGVYVNTIKGIMALLQNNQYIQNSFKRSKQLKVDNISPILCFKNFNYVMIAGFKIPDV